jgi:hypothetical protein
MKKLTLKEIAITIVVSYLATAYVQSDFNPFNWLWGVRVFQIVIISASMLIQVILKNND